MYKVLVCAILALSLAGCGQGSITAAYSAYSAIKKIRSVPGAPHKINQKGHLVPSEAKAEAEPEPEPEPEQEQEQVSDPADAGASQEDTTNDSSDALGTEESEKNEGAEETEETEAGSDGLPAEGEQKDGGVSSMDDTDTGGAGSSEHSEGDKPGSEVDLSDLNSGEGVKMSYADSLGQGVQVRNRQLTTVVLVHRSQSIIPDANSGEGGVKVK